MHTLHGNGRSQLEPKSELQGLVTILATPKAGLVIPRPSLFDAAAQVLSNRGPGLITPWPGFVRPKGRTVVLRPNAV